MSWHRMTGAAFRAACMALALVTAVACSRGPHTGPPPPAAPGGGGPGAGVTPAPGGADGGGTRRPPAGQITWGEEVPGCLAAPAAPFGPALFTLPAETGPAATGNGGEPAPELRGITDTWFVQLRRGGRLIHVWHGEERARILAEVEAALAAGQAALAASGPWWELWPRVLGCLEGRPALRMGYGDTSGPSGHPAPLVPTPLPPVAGQPAAGGKLALRATALWIAPPAAGGPGLLVATRVGPPDTQTLDLGCCGAGYSRGGEVQVFVLAATPALRALGEKVEEWAAAVPAWPPAEVRQALEEGERLARSGQWQAAVQAAEGALAHPVAQRDPEVRLRVGQVQYRAGGPALGVAVQNLLEASRLAEEYGDRDLLARAEAALAEVAERTPAVPDGSGLSPQLLARVHLRLAELRATAAAYRAAARAFLPEEPWYAAAALAAAHRARDEGWDAGAPAGLEEEGALHLAVAGRLLEPVSGTSSPLPEPEAARARAELERGRAEAPDHPYGRYLQGALRAWAGDWSGAAQAMAGEAAEPGRRRLAELYRALAAGAAARPAPLPADLAGSFVHSLSWSPDGRHLAVTAYGRNQAVWVLAAETGTWHRVHATDQSPVRLVGWSPDGAWLYVLGDGVWQVSPDGRRRVRLVAEAHGAQLSPDGTRLAYAQGGIHVLPLAGGSPVRLTRGRHDGHPLWAPDGQTIYFARDPGQNRDPGQYGPVFLQLARVPAAGGEAAVIDPEPVPVSSLQWAVPGETLLLKHGWDDGFAFRLVTAGGRRLRDLEGMVPGALPDALEWAPALGRGAAPHGTQVALYAPDGDRVLVPVLDMAPFPGLGRVHRAVLSPAGGMAYVATGPGATALWLDAMDGSHPRLLGLADPETRLAFAPDGRRLAAVGPAGWAIYPVSQ